MVRQKDYEWAKAESCKLMEQAGIQLSAAEVDAMDVADFGLSDVFAEGAQITSLYQTDNIAGRVIVLFPHQTEPEHWHVGSQRSRGKEETLRVISGELILVIEGEDNLEKAKIPEQSKEHYTCRHEVVLKPCDVITLEPPLKHWFQAGEEPCVFYTFSTTAIDETDLFTDPRVVRKTVIQP